MAAYALALTFLNFSTGRPQSVDPRDVATVVDLPASSLALGRLGCTITFTSGATAVLVQGDAASVRGQIINALLGAGAAESYAPVFTVLGGAAAVAVGLFRAVRIGQIVNVLGEFTYDPAVALAAEAVKFTLPPTMQPTAVFGATTDVVGLAKIGDVQAATAGASNINADMATRLAAVELTVPDVVNPIAVSLAYSIA